MKYLLSLREGKFLTQSLCYYGILLQDHNSHTVNSNMDLTIPYIIMTEGIVCDSVVNKQINAAENIIVIKNDKVVIEKRTTTDTMKAIFGNVLDLYDNFDNTQFTAILSEWENSEKIYIYNTEQIPNVNKTNSIAGLSSGTGLAKMAYYSEAKQVLFFDYKQMALDFQKELIYSHNRKDIFVKYLPFLTCGDIDATLHDIDRLDFIEIDKLYDNLKLQEISFIKVDFRNNADVTRLIDMLPKLSILWISNVFHYITTMNVYVPNHYDYLEKLCKHKDITILPYTKIYYES
jgi:hypothetical protein